MIKSLIVNALCLLAVLSSAACSGDAHDDDGDAGGDTGNGGGVDGGSDADADADSDSDADGDADPEGEIALADVADGRIFQRDGDGRHDLSVEGTYEGDPAEIRARVLVDGSDEVVVPWTTIDEADGDGAFSGVLVGVPEGGWYNLEVGLSPGGGATDRGESAFGVGALVVCAGQSHIDYWFDPAYGTGAPDAADTTRMYRHEQVRQSGQPWTGWQTVTGMGARVFANQVSEALGIPVGLLDYGVNGASLWQTNSLAAANGWWLSDESTRFPSADNYAVLVAGLESIGDQVEAVLWVQGHTDAMGGATPGVTTERYKEGLEELFAKMRADTGVPGLPVFISLVTRQQGPPLGSTDVNIQAVRDAEEQYAEQDDDAYLGCTTIDLPLRSDIIHHTAAGQEMQAKRLARSVLHVLHGAPPYDHHRGPRIEGYEIVDATTVDVRLEHSGGADFTPAGGIKGFTVLGDDVGGIVNATREDAVTIRLVIGGDTSTISAVRYLYGGNPGNVSLKTYAASYVHDDSPDELPLEGMADIPVL